MSGSTIRKTVVTAVVIAASVLATELTWAQAPQLVVRTPGENTELSLDTNPAFHTSRNSVTNPRLIDLSSADTLIVLWDETDQQGTKLPYYAIRIGGRNVNTVRPALYTIKLRYDRFDPHLRTPNVPPSLSAGLGNNLYIVQFVTQSLDAYRAGIDSLGGILYNPVFNHGHIVKMSVEARTEIEALPYVRWVGPFHPAYRLDAELLDELSAEYSSDESRRYIILAFQGDQVQLEGLADRIQGTRRRCCVWCPHRLSH